MAICDLDVAPAFERSKHHEEIGGAIALVLVIETGRASRFHRDRHARFGNELLRGFVEAMGLESVFLSARPIVLSLARSTMPSSTTSDTSAFNKIRAFSSRRAGLFPFQI